MAAKVAIVNETSFRPQRRLAAARAAASILSNTRPDLYWKRVNALAMDWAAVVAAAVVAVAAGERATRTGRLTSSL